MGSLDPHHLSPANGVHCSGNSVQLTQESETLWCEPIEFVFELGSVAARAWLGFLHVKVKHVAQNTSTDVLPQVGDQALATKEEWLSKIMPG